MTAFYFDSRKWKLKKKLCNMFDFKNNNKWSITLCLLGLSRQPDIAQWGNSKAFGKEYDAYDASANLKSLNNSIDNVKM